ncbi:hypothetical protein Xmau_01486 [Xenorhabdus mauleonii]|uniref:Rieske [2Fe-2S] domain-containing protein n=1 Tax=Xenorhabdus mauleonii TaxID=351675 RepID=A0A1I3PK95_9GAMM|nr:Rieske 2Fe-2S domain-containing protein [Xenorhabdus mauleonii]PHM44772.1 hypothetical protein Xmau_01486 [Xenorhabdus mauleonii]SFJ21913.1 Rieske [2Fe-2S] domain-containing protein [Xenorhabdus mauleonii]
MAIKKISTKGAKSLIVDLTSTNDRVAIYLDEKSVKALNDKCTHRGGPLHLCYRDSNNIRRCPWHDRPNPSDRYSSEVALIYYPKDETIILVAPNQHDEPWPVKVCI